MKTRRPVIPVSLVWLACSMPLAWADGNSWQMSTLFEPGPAQIERELKGRVMIYHGMKDSDVHRAMDEQFERLESMLFTGTIVTDETGQPLRDPVSGAVLVEDDGC